jgi:hypothetical protein
MKLTVLAFLTSVAVANLAIAYSRAIDKKSLNPIIPPPDWSLI